MQNAVVAKEARQEGWGMPKTRKQTLAGTKGIIPFTSGTSFGLLPLVEHEPPNIQRLAVHRMQGSGWITKLLTHPSPSSVNLFCYFFVPPDLV